MDEDEFNKPLEEEARRQFMEQDVDNDGGVDQVLLVHTVIDSLWCKDTATDSTLVRNILCESVGVHSRWS